MFDEPFFSIAVLAARILLSTVFLYSAVEKALNFQDALEEFTQARVPALKFSVAATIALHLVGSVCLIVGWLVPLMATALAVFTVLGTIRVHKFWTMSGKERLIKTRIALANIGVGGGLFLIAATGPGSFAL